MFSIIPNFDWLPWYMGLLLIFPIALFIIFGVWKIVTTVIDIITKVKGVFF